MKMVNKKDKEAKPLRNSELDLKILFPILEEIKDSIYKLHPKLDSEKVESLFTILSNISLLHHQILYSPKVQADKRQHYRLIHLNRANLEKSIKYFFQTSLNESADDTHDSLTIDQKNNSLSLFSSSPDLLAPKPNEPSQRKIKNQLMLHRQKYPEVNRSMSSSIQLSLPTPVEKKKKIYRSIYPSPLKKIFAKASLEPLNDFSLVKSNSITSCNISKDRDRHKCHSALKTETSKFLHSRQDKLYITYQSYQSFDQLPDEELQCKEITKPSNYAKSLLKKYKNVVDVYGEELKHSVNTSMSKRPSSILKTELKNEDKENRSGNQINIKLKSNSKASLIKIARMHKRK